MKRILFILKNIYRYKKTFRNGGHYDYRYRLKNSINLNAQVPHHSNENDVSYKMIIEAIQFHKEILKLSMHLRDLSTMVEMLTIS